VRDAVETIIEEGALARLKKDVNSEGRSWSKGTEFIVECFVSADEPWHGPAFYWGIHGPGIVYNVCFLAADVEQVKSAQQMYGRVPPTKAQIIEELGGDRDLAEFSMAFAPRKCTLAQGPTPASAAFGRWRWARRASEDFLFLCKRVRGIWKLK
jgi:hypothetical protein